MNTVQNNNIKELTWVEAEPYAKQGCPELYEILCKIDPPKDHTFIKATFPFGTTIMHEDSGYLPHNTLGSVPISHESIPTKLKTKLDYQSVPFGMIISNQVEVYREFDDKIFAVELSPPNKGIEIGIFEYFGLTPCYTVSSGARSLFMIPKISETRQHRRLTKHFHVNSVKPNNILKHWHTFRDLYNSTIFEPTWEAEILYLTKPWHKSLCKYSKTYPWSDLSRYILQKGFEHSGLGRRKVILDVLWEKVAIKINDEGFKPDPYTIDTMKHLFHIYMGGLSGFIPATDDFAGPITAIQEAYVEWYGLDKLPTIMRPSRFSYKENRPVYYSCSPP